VPAGVVGVLVLGGLFQLTGLTAPLTHPLFMAALLVTGGRVVWRTVGQLFRGHFATDVVASLAVLTAVILQAPIAGLIVVLMQTGGEALERYAEGRASQALTALEKAAPRIAHRLDAGGVISDISVAEIAIGDTLLIRPGENVPSDAIIIDGRSHVDTSQLTGEPIPVRALADDRLMSGSLNQEGSLTVRATATASESQYARIVELVRSAQASKAPLQRLADRYAVWFTPLTLAVCAASYIIYGEAGYVLAVLVVATPCPLILATPVAIIGGINRAARRQIIVRHGGALEQLAAARVAVFDKTGTLTIGLPTVSRVVTVEGTTEAETLKMAGSIEQGSSHLLARTLVDAAQQAGIQLPAPSQVTERPGRGVVGMVDGHEIVVGAQSFVLELHPGAKDRIEALDRRTSGLRAFVTTDGAPMGVVEYADRVRPGLAELFADLADLGITQTHLLSGDDIRHTTAVAKTVGIQSARANLLPEDKAKIVQDLVARGERVVMVGDGTNDAPALGTATVGVALSGHGGGITAEAADIVLLVDDLGRLTEAIRISRRTLRIARQSIWVGLGLSAAAMGFAAVGVIPPVAGALLQEAIDVAVILNALRASR
jgi:heavy metal translocating P-type ATPase